MTATQTKRKVFAPAVSEFGDGDFVESVALGELGAELIDQYEELAFLSAWRVRYLWKRKGGGSGGRATLGKLSVPSGLAGYFGMCDFVVWLAAEHVRLREFTDRQVAALLFHELLHCDVKGDDADSPTTKKPDFEAFNAEVLHFGTWKEDLREAQMTFTQMKLPDLD